MSLKDIDYKKYIQSFQAVPPSKEVYGISPLKEYAGQLYDNTLIAKMKEDVLKAMKIPEGYLQQGVDFSLGPDNSVYVKAVLKQADGKGSWKDIPPLDIQWITVGTEEPEIMENPFEGDPMFTE